MLLIRWGYSTPAHGGLRDNGGSKASQLLLGALVSLTYHDGGFAITLSLEDHWEARWPRPDDYRVHKVACHVAENGRIDLGALLAVGNGRNQSRVADRWVKALRRQAPDLNAITLSHLFACTASLKQLMPLAAQLTHAVAIRVEEKLNDQKEANPKRCPFVKFTWASLDEMLDSQMESRLSAYIFAAKDEIDAQWRVEHSMNLAVDKASVCGLGLHAGIMTFPSNLAVLAVPQVLGCETRQQIHV